MFIEFKMAGSIEVTVRRCKKPSKLEPLDGLFVDGTSFAIALRTHSLDLRITHLLVELSRLQQGYCFWSLQYLRADLSCMMSFT